MQSASDEQVRHDHQYIEITVRPHLAPGRRAEKDDPLRVKSWNKSAYEFPQKVFVRFLGTTRGCLFRHRFFPTQPAEVECEGQSPEEGNQCKKPINSSSIA